MPVLYFTVTGNAQVNNGNKTGEIIVESLTSHSFYDDNEKAVVDIDVEKNPDIIYQSSNGIMELYRENKELNDSIYTYF